MNNADTIAGILAEIGNAVSEGNTKRKDDLVRAMQIRVAKQQEQGLRIQNERLAAENESFFRGLPDADRARAARLQFEVVDYGHQAETIRRTDAFAREIKARQKIGPLSGPDQAWLDSYEGITKARQEEAAANIDVQRANTMAMAYEVQKHILAETKRLAQLEVRGKIVAGETLLQITQQTRLLMQRNLPRVWNALSEEQKDAYAKSLWRMGSGIIEAEGAELDLQKGEVAIRALSAQAEAAELANKLTDGTLASTTAFVNADNAYKASKSGRDQKALELVAWDEVEKAYGDLPPETKKLIVDQYVSQISGLSALADSYLGQAGTFVDVMQGVMKTRGATGTTGRATRARAATEGNIRNLGQEWSSTETMGGILGSGRKFHTWNDFQGLIPNAVQDGLALIEDNENPGSPNYSPAIANQNRVFLGNMVDSKLANVEIYLPSEDTTVSAIQDQNILIPNHVAEIYDPTGGILPTSDDPVTVQTLDGEDHELQGYSRVDRGTFRQALMSKSQFQNGMENTQSGAAQQLSGGIENQDQMLRFWVGAVRGLTNDPAFQADPRVRKLGGLADTAEAVFFTPKIPGVSGTAGGTVGEPPPGTVAPVNQYTPAQRLSVQSLFPTVDVSSLDPTTVGAAEKVVQGVRAPQQRMALLQQGRDARKRAGEYYHQWVRPAGEELRIVDLVGGKFVVEAADGERLEIDQSSAGKPYTKITLGKLFGLEKIQEGLSGIDPATREKINEGNDFDAAMGEALINRTIADTLARSPSNEEEAVSIAGESLWNAVVQDPEVGVAILMGYNDTWAKEIGDWRIRSSPGARRAEVGPGVTVEPWVPEIIKKLKAGKGTFLRAIGVRGWFGEETNAGIVLRGVLNLSPGQRHEGAARQGEHGASTDTIDLPSPLPAGEGGGEEPPLAGKGSGVGPPLGGSLFRSGEFMRFARGISEKAPQDPKARASYEAPLRKSLYNIVIEGLKARNAAVVTLGPSIPDNNPTALPSSRRKGMKTGQSGLAHFASPEEGLYGFIQEIASRAGSKDTVTTFLARMFSKEADPQSFVDAAIDYIQTHGEGIQPETPLRLVDPVRLAQAVMSLKTGATLRLGKAR